MNLKTAAQTGAVALLALVTIASTAPAAGAASAKSATHVHLTHKSIRVGHSTTVRVHVTPNLHGHTVVLQRYSKHKWHNIKHHALNSHSRHAFTLRPKHLGTHKYRVHDPKTKAGVHSSWSRVFRVTVHARRAHNCTSGYHPCIAPGSDVDCAGGSGNGPRYVVGPVDVTGSDPYGLDADHDGVACES